MHSRWGYYLLINLKLLFEEAILWKRLEHPNIVPFRGITLDPLQLVSELMPGGELREFILRNNKDANRIDIVGLFLSTSRRQLTCSSVTRHRQRPRLSPLA
jgi:serine/threonine protein kinase